MKEGPRRGNAPVPDRPPGWLAQKAIGITISAARRGGLKLRLDRVA